MCAIALKQTIYRFGSDESSFCLRCHIPLIANATEKNYVKLCQLSNSCIVHGIGTFKLAIMTKVYSLIQYASNKTSHCNNTKKIGHG